MFRTISTLFLAALLQLTSAVAFAQASGTANPASGMAKVVFYRAIDDAGGGRAYALTSQNQTLAKLKKGDKFEQVLAPGTYYYMADPSTKHVLKLELRADQTYYVRASRDENFFAGQPSLQLRSVQEYQIDLAKSD